MRAIGRDLTTRVVRVKYGHPLGRAPEATPIGTLDTEVFNKSKAMELPRNIVVGHDALHQVGEVCQALKLGKKALLVADENTLKIAGKTVEKELTARKVRVSEFVIPDATWEEIREGEERIRKGAFEFALGVGGGRSIDVAKCASFNAGIPFVSVPTPARRVENRFSMRYLGTDEGPAPRLKDVVLEDPKGFLDRVLDVIRRLIGAGVVHGDLSAFNVLVHEGEPWVIDFSEAIRVDRAGSSPWVRLTEARAALESGLAALQVYFRRYDLRIDIAACANELVESLDRFGVLH